jgi:hypothetical protein
MLQVKNLNFSAITLRNNLDVIKIGNNKLFGFNEVALSPTSMKGIRDEAAFLFTQVTKLRIREEYEEYLDTLVIQKVINDFQKSAKLEFIAVEFPLRCLPSSERVYREMLAQIGSIQLNDINFSHIKRLDMIFLCGGEKDADGRLVPGTSAWPALTELVLNDCEMDDMDVGCLFDFFPRLENLRIHSRLKISGKSVIFTKDTFRTMKNMRVLELNNVAVHSFEILDGGCMPLLEELYVRFADKLDSLTRIDSFPRFTKLVNLELYLKRVKWIHPKAFDHLSQLTVFGIHCAELEGDTVETGVAARSMSFHVACKVVKLNSDSVSSVEEIELVNFKNEGTTRLETVVALSGLKKLTASKWANESLPFHQMTNLEFVSLETSDLSIASSGQIKFMTKLRTLKVKSSNKNTLDYFSKYIYKV